MDITIQPQKLHGRVTAIPSKSQAHRLLICAAFADKPTELLCPETNRDIAATASCLSALGADITRTPNGYRIVPISNLPHTAELDCCDSGSTLRFLLPVAGALGIDTTFRLSGRLPQRPLSPRWEEMERMGCILSRPSPDTIRCQGKLQSGHFTIDGSISSQFITGLLLATALLSGDSELTLTGKIESLPYIEMTQKAMALFGANTENYQVSGGQRFCTPETITVEGDWSNGAFFLAASVLGNQISIENLNSNSPQGDRAVAELLPKLESFCEISAADIPDLVPILSVVAAAKRGAVFTEIARLRLKESDRVFSTYSMIRNLGGSCEAAGNTLTIYGTGLKGGIVDAQNDHRIAMSAAIAATVCTNPVTILGAECVSKSYPAFWDIYRQLGGVL